MSPFDLVPSALVQSLGGMLLHSLWQGAAVAVLLAVVLRVAGRRSELRHAAACGALVLLLVLPLITLVVLTTRSAATAPIPAAMAAGPAPAAATVARAALAPTRTPEPLPIRVPADRLPLVVGLWVFGVAAGSLRLGRDMMAVARLRRGGRPVPPPLARMLAMLQRRMRFERPIALRLSDAVDVPVVFGWLQPIILFPAGLLTGLAPEQVRVILAHELAHLRRGDYFVSVLQALAETLFFYQPAVWWASRVIRREREYLCDETAVELCADPVGYARALLRLEQLRIVPALTCAANAGDLTDRVRRLLDPARRRRRSLRGRWAAPAAVVVGALLLTLPLISTAAGPAHDIATGRADAEAGGESAAATTPPLESAGAATARRGSEQPPRAPDAAPDLQRERAETESATVDGVSATDRERGRLFRDAAGAETSTPRVRPEMTVQDLVDDLSADNQAERELAAWALGYRGDGHSVVPLLRALSDASSEVRAQAAWALGRVGDSRASLPLLALLEGDPDVQVRAQAAWALARRSSPQVTAGLAGALGREPAAEVRVRIAWALGHHAGPNAVASLIDALDDPVPTVRRRVAWALGRMGDASAVPVLVQALSDDAPVVRAAAAWALGNLGDASVLAVLDAARSDPSAQVRRRAEWAARTIRQQRDLARGILPGWS